jgi:hypothetical protein
MFNKQSDWRKNMANPRQRMDLENCAIKKRIERDQSRRGDSYFFHFDDSMQLRRDE